MTETENIIAPFVLSRGLTDEQEAVMAAIDRFIGDPCRQLFTVHGLAGTGKTTLLGHVARQYDHDALCCPTGKAASVLRAKIGLNASTIHAYFYKLLRAGIDDGGRERLTFAPRHDGGALSGELVLVDECSMVPHWIGAQLIRTGAKVIAVGDPGQLPPVRGRRFFTEPDTELRKIHRQAWESPIIRQAMAVRYGKPYRSDGPDFQIARSITKAQLVDADVVLCWRNETCSKINGLCRRLAGHTSPCPEAGEPLLCLKNAPRYGIWNGGIYLAAANCRPGDTEISLVVDGEIITVPDVLFCGQDSTGSFEAEATTRFNFGYCLTVHKAQGSEWPRVLLIDDYHTSRHRREWLYTGLTRAAQSIVVVPA
jgi:exodeoxyribonuclease-5